MTFTLKEQQIILNALRVARLVYQEDAQASRDVPRLAEAFEKQAREALEVMDKIETLEF